MPRKRKPKPPSEPAAVWVATAELVPWDKNPKVHEPGQVERICESIRRTAEDVAARAGKKLDLLDGWGAALTARAADKSIVAGHGRVLAAERLGIPYLPVRFLDISAEQAQRLCRADNRLGEPALAPWDMLLLVDGLKADFEQDPSLLTMQGWQDFELQDMVNQLSVPDFQPSDDEPPRLDQGGSDDSDESPRVYAIVTECEDEDDQAAKLAEMAGKGWRCRAI